MKDYNLYIIDRSIDGMLLGSFLKNHLRLSHRMLIMLKKNQLIKLNGDRTSVNVKLKEGDRVEFELLKEESENIFPEPMDLDIVYEDEYMIVINKPCNMPVHPTRNHIMGTLANGLVYYWMGRERSTVIRPVNRLDKDTSGLVVFAKNSHIQYLLTQQMPKENFRKEYIAVIEGIPQCTKNTIDLPIAREAPNSIKRTVSEDGVRAITHYEVVEAYKNSCMIRLWLETGRTHQIRVHMSYIGHSLLGDELYGKVTGLINRHALHANKINMLHPVTNEWMEFSASIPQDMKELIFKLRSKKNLNT